VIAFHWDPEKRSSYRIRLPLLILLFFDTVINVFSVVLISTIVPFQLLNTETPLDFVLNLVAVFYIIELDDFLPVEQHKLQERTDSIGDNNDDDNDDGQLAVREEGRKEVDDEEKTFDENETAIASFKRNESPSPPSSPKNHGEQNTGVSERCVTNCVKSEIIKKKETSLINVGEEQQKKDVTRN